MSAPLPADRARASVLVAAAPDEAFRIFTEEIDRWWRHGLRYRVGVGRSVVALEPKVGGRLLESIESAAGITVIETGRVRHWEPPRRLVFSWRAGNFAPDESTEVEVVFAPSASGTTVTVIHRGWAALRPDHPVRHGADLVGFIGAMGMWWGDLLSSLRECAAKSRSAP